LSAPSATTHRRNWITAVGPGHSLRLYQEAEGSLNWIAMPVAPAGSVA